MAFLGIEPDGLVEVLEGVGVFPTPKPGDGPAEVSMVVLGVLPNPVGEEGDRLCHQDSVTLVEPALAEPNAVPILGQDNVDRLSQGLLAVQ
jgi:hypothetical protein